jgi:hypothetical protein
MFSTKLFIKFVTAIGVLSSAIVACSGTRSVNQKGNNLRGYIYLVSGNQMPQFGKQNVSKGKGVSRDIYFYMPATINDVKGSTPKYTEIHTPLILHTKSDSLGYYKAKLRPGAYSVFIKEGGIFFASEQDANGYINYLKIDGNNDVVKDYTISLSAYY